MKIKFLKDLLESSIIKAPLNEDQEYWLEQYNSEDRIVQLVGDRASGRTSFGLGVCIARAIANGDSCVVVCQNRTLTSMTLKNVADIVSELGVNQVVSLTKNDIVFDNGGRIKFTENRPNTFRGLTCQLVFIDFNCYTVAHLDRELMMNVLPIIHHIDGAKLLVSV